MKAPLSEIARKILADPTASKQLHRAMVGRKSERTISVGNKVYVLRSGRDGASARGAKYAVKATSAAKAK